MNHSSECLYFNKSELKIKHSTIRSLHDVIPRFFFCNECHMKLLRCYMSKSWWLLNYVIIDYTYRDVRCSFLTANIEISNVNKWVFHTNNCVFLSARLSSANILSDETLITISSAESKSIEQILEASEDMSYNHPKDKLVHGDLTKCYQYDLIPRWSVFWVSQVDSKDWQPSAQHPQEWSSHCGVQRVVFDGTNSNRGIVLMVAWWGWERCMTTKQDNGGRVTKTAWCLLRTTMENNSGRSTVAAYEVVEFDVTEDDNGSEVVWYDTTVKEIASWRADMHGKNHGDVHSVFECFLDIGSKSKSVNEWKVRDPSVISYNLILHDQQDDCLQDQRFNAISVSMSGK